jgi:hypothetical protein
LAKRTLENEDVKVEAKRTRHDKDKSSKDSEESEDSEESRKIVREDPHVFVLAPDGVSKYIVRKYTDDMAGTNILYKCAVTLPNGRLFSEEEVFDFWRKSTAACPTYGPFLLPFAPSLVQILQTKSLKAHIHKFWNKVGLFHHIQA